MERPHLRYIEAGNVAPTPSIAAVTAPGKALGQFGEVLAGLGEKGFQIATQIRESDEKGKLSTWRARSAERMATFSDSLLQRQDFQNWEADTEKELKEIGAEIDGMKLSPVAEASAKEYFTAWASEKRIALGSQVASRTVSEGRLRTGQAAAYHAARGEITEAHDLINNGPYTAGEKPPMLREASRQGQLFQYGRRISERPREAASQIKDPSFLTKHPDLTAADHSDLATQAHQEQRKQAYTAVEEALGPIGRALRTAGDFLGKFSARLSPVAIGTLADRIHEAVTDGVRRQRATPEYAQQVTGEVSAMLGSWQPDADDFDEKYASMITRTRTLPEGPARSRLETQLEDLRQNRLGQVRDNYDLARRDILQAYQENGFGDISGKGTVSISLRGALDDGLLQDRAKLQRLGYTTGQADGIARLSKEEWRIAEFRKSFSKRTGIDQTTPLERAAYLAIRDDKPHSTVIEVENQEAKVRHEESARQAQRVLGRVLTELDDFALANPNASATDIFAARDRIVSGEVRKRQAFTTPRPSTTGHASSNDR
jgi:hypothetical protein